MKLVEDIKQNQIEYLKSINISVLDFKVTYHSDKNIIYNIDIELNNKKIHIVISYNWEFKNAGIQIYKDNKFKMNKSSEIYSIDDLNHFITNIILKDIYK